MLNGKLIPEDKAAIPPISSGLYYGAGAFETLLSDEGQIFKFIDHIDRLNAGLKYLGVHEKQAIDADSILVQIRNLLKKNQLFDTKAKIRVQVSLTEKHGYSKFNNPAFITIITSAECKAPKTPQVLILSDVSVISSSARPAKYKLSNMLHYRQAFREAEKKGADDSIMLTAKGFVAETSIANIFWIKGKEVFTPSEECDILPGIMRNSVVEIIRNETDFGVNEGNYSMDELLNADAVWITNSVIGFIPVSKIENQTYNTETSFFSDLGKLLVRYKKENMTDV